jgi:hypothetical protein
LALPGTLFVRAAYRYVLRREADEGGLRHYTALLSCGFGKDAVLIDLINSREAQKLAEHNNTDVSGLRSGTLVRELEQLQESHKRGLLGKWRRVSHYIRKLRRFGHHKRELNALEFKLENTFSSMLGRMQDHMVEELAHRVVFQADTSGALTNSRVVSALQAQRRAVSRPASSC